MSTQKKTTKKATKKDKKVYFFLNVLTLGNNVTGVQTIKEDTLSAIKKKWVNYSPYDTTPIMTGIEPVRPKPKLTKTERIMRRMFDDIFPVAGGKTKRKRTVKK